MDRRSKPRRDPARDSWEGEIEAVRRVIGSFHGAVQSSFLYSLDHTICKRNLAKFRGHLERFLVQHDLLRLEVTKEGFRYEGELVYREESDSGSPSFMLFRDGILWLELRRGIDLREIRELCRILKTYRNPQAEADGDLVTALWEAQLPHVLYRAADVLWEGAVEGKAAILGGDLISEGAKLPGSAEAAEYQHSPDLPTAEPALFQMSQEEEWSLRGMVLEEEKQETDEDVLEMLMDLLHEDEEEEDLMVVLAFLEERFRDAVLQGDFATALKLVKRMLAFHRFCESRRPWALPLLDSFFMTVSDTQFLQALGESWSDEDPWQQEEIMEILRHLPPEAMRSLASLLARSSSPVMEKAIGDVIAHLAEKDLGPLVDLLARVDKTLLKRLLPLLGRVEGERPVRVLLNYVRHPSIAVRKEAVRTLVFRGPWALQTLFPLIDDESDSVRRLVLEGLGWRRSEAAERLLLDYLGRKTGRLRDREHLLACLRALGKCGSDRSVPFLREKLLGRGWMPGIRRGIWRQGAALALSALATEGARKALAEAEKSPYPGVKHAVRKVHRDRGWT